jgi:hypothetical protein
LLFQGSRFRGLWYSGCLCEDARPFAPHMSCGSRATQAKPEALPSCSEKIFASFAGLPMCMQARISLGKSSFCAPEIGRGASLA